MLLCAVTSRILLADTEAERAEKLVALAAHWAAGGVNFIQIRERGLAEAELLPLSSRIVQAVRHARSATRVLINSSPGTACAIALQSGADGLHLPGGLDPEQLATAVMQIRELWKSRHKPTLSVSVSCHTATDIRAARAAGATLALFAPVFEKALPGAPSLSGQGLDSLARACAAARQPTRQPELPVLALGGVTLQNAAECVAAGAAGVAAIRLFLNSDSDEGQDWRRLLLPQSPRQVPVPPQS